MTPKPTPPLVIDVEPEDDKPETRAHNCGNCSAGLFNKTNKMGNCRRSPPTHFIFLVPQPDVLGRGMTLGTQDRAAWPAVERTQWCRDGWEAKDKH